MSVKEKGGLLGDGGKTYKIGKRIQLLPHHAALFPPPRNFTVEKVKEQPQRQEPQRPVERRVGFRVQRRGEGARGDAVPQRGKDGEDAAEAVELGDEVGQVEGANEGEVAYIGREEEVLLVVFYCWWVGR